MTGSAMKVPPFRPVRRWMSLRKLKFSESLAHGQSIDAELLGEFTFRREAVTGSKVSERDRRRDGVGDLGVQHPLGTRDLWWPFGVWRHSYSSQSTVTGGYHLPRQLFLV